HIRSLKKRCSMSEIKAKHPPGSLEAIVCGCTCPIRLPDNNVEADTNCPYCSEKTKIDTRQQGLSLIGGIPRRDFIRSSFLKMIPSLLQQRLQRKKEEKMLDEWY